MASSAGDNSSANQRRIHPRRPPMPFPLRPPSPNTPPFPSHSFFDLTALLRPRQNPNPPAEPLRDQRPPSPQGTFPGSASADDLLSHHVAAHGRGRASVWPALTMSAEPLSVRLLGLAANAASLSGSIRDAAQQHGLLGMQPPRFPVQDHLSSRNGTRAFSRASSQPMDPFAAEPRRASMMWPSAESGVAESEGRFDNRGTAAASGGREEGMLPLQRRDSHVVQVNPPGSDTTDTTDSSPTGSNRSGWQQGSLREGQEGTGREQIPGTGTGRGSGERMSLSQAARWMEQGVPFMLLLIVVFVRENIAACSTFVWLTMAMVRGNDFVRKQAALKEQRSRKHLLAMALVLVCHAAVILWLFGSQELSLALSLQPLKHNPSFLHALFLVFLNDNLVRFLGMACKCLLLASFSTFRGPHSRRQAQMLSLVEYSMLLYRVLLPTPVWYKFFLNERTGRLFSALVTGLYLTVKLTAVVDRVILFLTCLRQVFRQEVLFGKQSTSEEVHKAGDMCSICHDKMHTPITLRCAHVFCEDCVSEWFEREHTCPLCRAVVKASSIKSYGDATTALNLQFF